MLSHLFQIAADLSVGLDQEPVFSPELVADGLKFLRAYLPRFGNLPVEQVLMIHRDWVPVKVGSYCPKTFDESVPELLSKSYPVVEHEGFLFVYGTDGYQAFYWKFENAA